MILSLGNAVRFTVRGIKDKGSHYACSSLLLLASLSVFLPDLPVLDETLQYSAFISFASSKAWISIWEKSLSFCLKEKKHGHIFKMIFASRHDEYVRAWIPRDRSVFHWNYFLLLHSDQDTPCSRDWNSSLKIEISIKFLGIKRQRENPGNEIRTTSGCGQD